MSGAAILQLLGAGGFAAVLVAVINAIFNRKKMSADVVKTINEAAGGVVERVEADNQRLRNENQELEDEVRQATKTARLADDRAYAAERRSARLAEVLREYVDYTRRQSEVIRELGGRIEDPPDVAAELLI